MAQVTYGSITLVDLTDVGQLSVYPTSNQPLSIIYDPDQKSYTPNWGVSSTNLILTPVIYYNNTSLTATTTGVTITWKRRVGSGDITNLTTGETQQSNGSLKVTANKFTPESSMISYIVIVEYIEPETKKTLTAEGQITFSLVKLAASAKTCIISGDTVFKYNTNGTRVSSDTIVLTAKTNNVQIQEWQYKNAQGTWTQITSGEKLIISGDTLTVKDDAPIFISDIATIQVITNDPNVYDIHCITKLRDGAPGDKAVSAVLTNENQMIPCDANGDPVTGAFNGATTQIIIFNGGIDDTENWTITAEATGVTMTTSKTTVNNDTVAINGISGATGKVTFTCTRKGDDSDDYADITKVFSLMKSIAGTNGTSPIMYTLECSSIAINKTTPSTEGGAVTYTPSSIVITGYSQDGNKARAQYAGRFQITSGDDVIYTSGTNQKTYTITTDNIATAAANGSMTVKMYKAGGVSAANLLDTQTIIFTSDGAKGGKGDTGNDGADSINVVLGNYADVIPCTPDNTPQAKFIIDIPFVGYKGITQVPCNVATPSKICNVSAAITQATASAVGHIKYTLTTSTNMSSASSGTVSLTFTCEGATIVHTYTWTRSTASRNAVLFELYAPNGNVFTSRTSQDLTIQGRIMDGNTEGTDSVTSWTWEKWDGSYSPITTTEGKYTINGKTLTVNNSAVDGYASFKCTAQYSGKSYTAYYVLLDKLDPIQASVFCSLGEQIVNGQGIGAFYVIVTDTGTGQELDPLKSDRFLTEAPTNPAVGDFYYHLDSTDKSITLKKYTSTGWTNAGTSDLPKGKYTWSFRDSSGNATTFNGHAEITNASNEAGIKAIYVDGTLITKKIIVDVKVEI